MNISKIVKLECCEVNFKAKNKEEALLNITNLLRKSIILNEIDSQRILSALKEREEQGSTGFNNGIAIPHCQLEGIDNFVISIAICKKGIDFDSLDGKKSKIFITIIGPTEKKTEHLKLLAKVSHTLKESGVIELLLKSTTKIGLYEEFLRNATVDEISVSKKTKDKLMIIIVKDESIMQDISELFLEYGIEEATIIETQQMENLFAKVPLFLGFFNFTGGKSPFSKIIILKTNKEYINAIIKAMEEIFGDLDNYTGLDIMVLNLFFSK